MNEYYIKEVGINDYDCSKISQIIYNNFLYLKDIEYLKHTLDEISKLLNSEDFMGFFIYNSNNILIGYLIGEIMQLSDGRLICFISYFYVASKHRKKGLGKNLINKCIEKCKTLGLSFISLNANKTNTYIMNYYSKIGFVNDLILEIDDPYTILTLYI